jgi:hypothetical protein
MSPDSDAEVKLKWDDGSESGYVKAVRVEPLTSSEKAQMRSGGAALTNDAGAPVKPGRDADSWHTFYCGSRGDIHGSDGYCGPDNGPQCASCKRLQAVPIQWCVKGAFGKQGSKVGEVLMDPDSDADVKVRWSDGTESGYIKAVALAEASTGDQRSAADWCSEGVRGKYEGNVGTLTMSPDSQAQVKLKWDDDAAQKVKQERLAAAAPPPGPGKGRAEQERLAREKAERERLAAEKAEEERLATEKIDPVDWCRKGAFAKQGSQVGQVLDDPDSDAEVQVRWSDGTLSSAFIAAAALSQASSEDQLRAAAWCKNGVGGKYQRRIGKLTTSPNSDVEVKLRWDDDGSESEYVKAVCVHPLWNFRASVAAGTELWMHADALLQSSWAKTEDYEFGRLTEVREIFTPTLLARYDEYKQSLPTVAGIENGNEQLLFHGCASAVIDSIAEKGLLRAYQTTATGSWQRFGPGFYFALQASKSHEYPIADMQGLPPGVHSRKMILCKVAKGNVLKTSVNMDQLPGAPQGYHSVHGVAQPGGPLNYDELVVYDEAAILPFAVVTYEFTKQSAQIATDGTEEQAGGGSSAAEDDAANCVAAHKAKQERLAAAAKAEEARLAAAAAKRAKDETAATAAEVSVADQRSAADWCSEGSVSGYVMAVRVHPLTSSENERLAAEKEEKRRQHQVRRETVSFFSVWLYYAKFLKSRCSYTCACFLLAYWLQALQLELEGMNVKALRERAAHGGCSSESAATQ